MSFRDKVLSIVFGIKLGQTMTYGQVATLAGNKKAARAVGAILRTNFNPQIPCHRVVAASGLGGYNRGLNNKLKLLKQEKAL